MKHKQVQLRRLFSSSIGGSWGGPPEDGDLVLPCVRGTDLDFRRLRVKPDSAPLRSYTSQEVAYRAASQGDIIIEKSGGGDKQPVGRIALWDRFEPVMPTNFAGRLRPSPGHEPRYLAYLLAALYYEGRTVAAIKQTTGIQNLDLHAFLSTRVQLLELPIQRAIADYLDIETGRIDALISKKRRMIELLEERMLHAARALTTGRGDVAPLRRFARAVKTGTTPPARELNALTAEEVPWFSPGDVGPYLRMLSPERMLSWRSLSDGWTPLFPADSTVVVGIGTVGRIGHTATVSTGNQQMTCITPNTRVVPRFLSWQLWAREDELRETAPYTTLPILNNDFLRSVSISVPPLDQQASIVTRLDREADGVLAVSKRLHVQIDLLAERRQALITAAVTGELAVMGASV